jgi:hypothetical protein
MALGVIGASAAVSSGSPAARRAPCRAPGPCGDRRVGALLVVFAFAETQTRYPVLDLSLFALRVFKSATLSLVLSFLAMFALGGVVVPRRLSIGRAIHE